MSRFFPPLLSPTRFFRFSCSPAAALAVGCLVFGPGTAARADEFSVLPSGDPIVRQLAQIAPKTAPGGKTAPLTRYEAALQTARVISDVQSREAGTTSRAQWRAIDALCGSLKSELRQLGVDVEATRALTAKNLKSSDQNGDAAPTSLLSRASVASKPAGAANSRGGATGNTLLTPELVANSSAATLVNPRGANSSGASLSAADSNSVNGALEMRLLPGLRVATGLQTASRAAPDSSPNQARFAPGLALNRAPESASESRAAQTELSYDLGRYLTLRAANSRLNWNGLTGGNGENPLLGAPVFAGARGASGTGGGVDFNLGTGLKFSTEIEKLRADTGASASRIGGGASLSAFQDRLLLQMSLSRLLPGDKSALTTTAAQVGASLDVSPRLSLNLRYQGLFAPTPNVSAARVAGGVSLSF